VPADRERYHDLEQRAFGHGLNSFSRQTLHYLACLIVREMATRTESHEVLRATIRLDVVDVRDGQRSLVRVEFLAGKSALQTALLALPPGLILDAFRDLVPIGRIL